MRVTLGGWRARAVLLVALVGAAVAASVLAGGATSANKRYKIIMLSASNVIPGWHGYDRGAKEAAKRLGVDLEIAQWASLEPKDLIAGINAVVAKNPDAALFSAVNDKAEQNALEQAAKRIKKIVIFDSPAVDPTPFATYVGSPAAAEGKAAADVLAKLIGGKGKVLQIDAAPGFSTLVINQKAFRKQIETKYPNIELLPLQWDGGDPAKNAAIVKATLARHPDLAGAYLGTSGLGAEGGVGAIRAAGKIGKIKIVTLDGLPAAIEDLRKGYQQAVISVKLRDLGGGAVESAVKALDGEKLPKTQFTGYCVLTKQNINKPENSQCIYISKS
jgi:ribose transport system substrate-binding protein